MKPFNLQQALAGKPVVTRDGRPVPRLAHFPELRLVQVFIQGHPSVISFNEDGSYLTDSVASEHDLFMASEKKTVWVNFRKAEPGGIFVGIYTYTSKEAAESAAGACVGHLGTYPVEIEV